MKTKKFVVAKNKMAWVIIMFYQNQSIKTLNTLLLTFKKKKNLNLMVQVFYTQSNIVY